MRFLFTRERARDLKSQVGGIGGGVEETADSIKSKYESNANTNALTDSMKNKLDNLNPAEDISSFEAALESALHPQL